MNSAMRFYSHSKKFDNVIEGSKELKDHITSVLKITLSIPYENLDFGIERTELVELISYVIKLHDLGKYTRYFQNYLLKKPPIDNYLKQHSRIGGICAFNGYKKRNEKLAVAALFLIFQHHSNLIDIEEIPKKFDFNLEKLFECQRKDLLTKIDVISNEIDFSNLKDILIWPSEKEIRKIVKYWTVKERDIRYYFILNYLFSLLIEADKLDASDTQFYRRMSLPDDLVDKRFGKPFINEDNIHNVCRAEVISHLKKEDILDHYLFTLTAPTGTGKTMTALDFALKLRAKLRLKEEFEAPIIYALPFINIIEQALKEYEEKTFKGEGKILAHYQFADVFSHDKSDEKSYNQKLMELDTWQGDVIITSFVQFFETLIGNRNKLLKKFNRFAGAIIILDEVQTLRLDQMPLIGAVLHYMSKFLKSRIILMTATKPKIFELAQQQILNNEGEIVKPYELLVNHRKIFEAFHRTKIVPFLNVEFEKSNKSKDFIEKIFSSVWKPDQSCLIVCNTVNRSIELYYSVSAYFVENKYVNTVFYLSTNIVPSHRLKRIIEIKDMINKGLAPVLISTQVVEAGVDLDFDIGFRDIGPIDSMVQVAGRVNRNNNIYKKDSPVYVTDFGDAPLIYGRITYQQAKKALNQQKEFCEKDYFNLIESYFNEISDRKSFTQYNQIFESMKSLKYDSEIKEDYPVSSFKIIQDSYESQSVFVEIGTEEAELREKYYEKLTGKLSKEEFDKTYKRRFQQSIIVVPKFYVEGLNSINEFEMNILVITMEQISIYYDFITGLKRKRASEVTAFL